MSGLTSLLFHHSASDQSTKMHQAKKTKQTQNNKKTKQKTKKKRKNLVWQGDVWGPNILSET